MGEESFSRIANATMQFLTQMFSRIPELLLSIFVFCAALYFFLAEAAPLKNIFARQKVLNGKETKAFVELIQKSSYNTVVSSVIIGVIQASMVALGALILSTGDILVVWVVTFFSSFIPVLGAGPVALSLGVGCLIFGDVGRAIGFVVVAAVTATVDNIVRPYLLSSGGDDLHPIISLLAIIGAVLLFGMTGLFIGPVIASVAVKIIPVLYGADEKLQETTAAGKDPG
jgi:predicted PurR-regulated permease PerM